MKKYQIFISSTYEDLKIEREKVRDSILRMRHFPIGMEQFSASNSAQWEIIKECIDTSDYYVLIIGKKYGSVIQTGEDAGISYTEKEFNYAVSQGVPVLAFIKSDKANFSGTAIEQDADKVVKLADFTSRVKSSYEVNWFDNPYELGERVSISLHNEMEKNDRPGWIRGGKVEPDDDWDDDFDSETADYEFSGFHIPTDGMHKKVTDEGVAIAEGEWKNNKLVKGVEYDWLIQVTQGKLIFKPDCPEDPYDSTDDFEYEKFEQYGWHPSNLAFFFSESYIEHEGLDNYYVVDMQVDKNTEQMFNIRTLEEFLSEKAPERLELFRGLSEEA